MAARRRQKRGAWQVLGERCGGGRQMLAGFALDEIKTSEAISK